MRFLEGNDDLFATNFFKQRLFSNWDFAEERMLTQYGEITYRDWLEHEKQRIEKKGGSIYIWKREDGMVCATYGHPIVVGETREVLSAVDWPAFAI